MHKSDMRVAALEQRKSLSQLQRTTLSKAIITSLHAHFAEQASNVECLFIYRAMPSEVVVDDLLQSDSYRIFAPVTSSDASMQWLEVTAATRWKKGVFGILEPEGGNLWSAEAGVTTLLCPLIGFDRQGNRLGMGKGCFDMWLSQHRGQIQQVIGLAYSCQEVAQIPFDSHDMPMDYVITEKEVIRCMHPSQKI